MKKEMEQPVQEYRFHYHFGDSVGSSDKYFMAHDLDESKEMAFYQKPEHDALPRLVDPLRENQENQNRRKPRLSKIYSFFLKLFKK